MRKAYLRCLRGGEWKPGRSDSLFVFTSDALSESVTWPDLDGVCLQTEQLNYRLHYYMFVSLHKNILILPPTLIPNYEIFKLHSHLTLYGGGEISNIKTI